MDIELGPEDLAFREDVRSFFAENAYKASLKLSEELGDDPLLQPMHTAIWAFCISGRSGSTMPRGCF